MKIKGLIRKLTITSGILLVWSVAALAQNITYDVAPGTDFSKYKTYKWKRADKAMYPDQSTDQILMSSIDTELASKGLTKSDSDAADLYVTYQLSITNDAQLSTFTNDIQWQGGANSLAGFKGATTNSTNLIQKGWLMVDLYDVGQKKNVWHASANKTLGKSAEPKKMEKNSKKAMARVFSNYPPQSK
jgi:hypothetical protein